VTLLLYESAKHFKVQMLHARYFDPKLATSSKSKNQRKVIY